MYKYPVSYAAPITQLAFKDGTELKRFKSGGLFFPKNMFYLAALLATLSFILSVCISLSIFSCFNLYLFPFFF